jgi:hypothetical protein
LSLVYSPCCTDLTANYFARQVLIFRLAFI